MDWSNESYVRLYIRDTVTWKRLRWQGQTVLMHLLRKVDRSGLMDGIENIILDVSIMTGLPEDVVESGMKSLFDEGVFTQKGTTLFMPNFLDAQETPKSDRQRQRESREKRRLSQNVTDESQNVTNCHDVTDGVTRGHEVSLYPMPSCALPSNTNTPKPPNGGDVTFDVFWKHYPKKVGKQAALKAWKRMKPGLQKCVDAIALQKQSDQWRKDGGQYIPNPATWINQGRWDDEVKGMTVSNRSLPPLTEKDRLKPIWEDQ